MALVASSFCDKATRKKLGRVGQAEGSGSWSGWWGVGACERNGCYRWGYCFAMARGNQRELSRQKNMKKAQEHSKGKRKEDALSASQRKQRDSEIMQQKQKAANEKKTHQAGAK
ncbi:small EDRK-rich factor 1 [Protobothrops mucrosquamatus]|uniref:small EDRK-rich factor 1 n=1 Tax=Protobothrops mucrosquamatus TaxID=103944 RepID=UPI0010FBB580|nr:small EDRK-rich factor 1 [Protobothrops mucrosquamatus]